MFGMTPNPAMFGNFARLGGAAAGAFNPLSLLGFAPGMLGMLGGFMKDPRQQYINNAAAQFNPGNMAQRYQANFATQMQDPRFRAMLQQSAMRGQMGNANIQRTLGTKLGLNNTGVVHSINTMPAVMNASNQAQNMSQFQAQGAANAYMQGAGMGMPLSHQMMGAGLASWGQAMPFFMANYRTPTSQWGRNGYSA